MARRTDVLKRVPLFQSLSARQLRGLHDIAEQARYMDGASVVRAGEPGDALFVILEGQAKVVSPKGRVITRLLPGDFFGEISLLDGGLRTASVVTETPLAALIIRRSRFLKVVGREPAVAMHMLREVAGRLRRAERPLSA